MRNFPVIGVLKNGEHITDLEHSIFNTFSIAILQCKLNLSESLSLNETATIYVYEDTNQVSVTLPNGSVATFE